MATRVIIAQATTTASHRTVRRSAVSRSAIITAAADKNSPTSSSTPSVVRARGPDFIGASECFVRAFFFDGAAEDSVSPLELNSLVRAQKADLLRRYNRKGAGALFVAKNDDGQVIACVGVETQRFVGALPESRAVAVSEDNVRGNGGGALSPPVERPVIANLAVSKSARRRGLAKQLMAAVETEASSMGFDECVLVVEATNGKAKALYSRLGYRTEGVDPTAPSLKVKDGKARETPVKALTMRKSLSGDEGGGISKLGGGILVLVLIIAAAAASLTIKVA